MENSREEIIEAIDRMITVCKKKELDLSGCAYLEFRNPVVSGENFENIEVTSLCVPFEEMESGFKSFEVILEKQKFLNDEDKPISTFKEVFSFKEM